MNDGNKNFKLILDLLTHGNDIEQHIQYKDVLTSIYQDALDEIERRTPPNNRIFVVLPTELSKEQCEQINGILSAGLLKAGFCTVCDEGDDPRVLHYYQCAIALEKEA